MINPKSKNHTHPPPKTHTHTHTDPSWNVSMLSTFFREEQEAQDQAYHDYEAGLPGSAARPPGPSVSAMGLGMGMGMSPSQVPRATEAAGASPMASTPAHQAYMSNVGSVNNNAAMTQQTPMMRTPVLPTPIAPREQVISITPFTQTTTTTTYQGYAMANSHPQPSTLMFPLYSPAVTSPEVPQMMVCQTPSRPIVTSSPSGKSCCCDCSIVLLFSKQLHRK